MGGGVNSPISVSSQQAVAKDWTCRRLPSPYGPVSNNVIIESLTVFYLRVVGSHGFNKCFLASLLSPKQ